MNNNFKKTILIVAISLVLSLTIAYNIYVPSMKNIAFGNINIAVPKEYNCNEEEDTLLSHMTFISADNKTSIIYYCYKTSEMTNVEKELTEESIATIKHNMTKEGNVVCEKINDVDVLTDANRKLLLFERNDNMYIVSIDTPSNFISYYIAKKIMKSIY